MIDQKHKQDHALEYPFRKELLQELQSREEGATIPDLLKVFAKDYRALAYHLSVLVDAGLAARYTLATDGGKVTYRAASSNPEDLG